MCTRRGQIVINIACFPFTLWCKSVYTNKVHKIEASQISLGNHHCCVAVKINFREPLGRHILCPPSDPSPSSLHPLPPPPMPCWHHSLNPPIILPHPLTPRQHLSIEAAPDFVPSPTSHPHLSPSMGTTQTAPLCHGNNASLWHPAITNTSHTLQTIPNFNGVLSDRFSLAICTL